MLHGVLMMRCGRYPEAERRTNVTPTLARPAAIGAHWQSQLALVAGNSQATGQFDQLRMNVSTLLLQLNIISPH